VKSSNSWKIKLKVGSLSSIIRDNPEDVWQTASFESVIRSNEIGVGEGELFTVEELAFIVVVEVVMMLLKLSYWLCFSSIVKLQLFCCSGWSCKLKLSNEWFSPTLCCWCCSFISFWLSQVLFSMFLSGGRFRLSVWQIIFLSHASSSFLSLSSLFWQFLSTKDERLLFDDRLERSSSPLSSFTESAWFSSS